MEKAFGFLIAMAIITTSCASNQIKESEIEALKDKLISNYGVERTVFFDEEGRLVDMSIKETANKNESSCAILWSKKINERIVLEKKSEEVQIKEIVYNGKNLLCIQGVNISMIKENLGVEDFDIIQNRYTCGLLALKDMIKDKEIFVLAGNLQTNVKSGQNVILLVFECGKNGKVVLMQKFYYFWPIEQQYNLALSYDMNNKRIMIDKAESEGSIEIIFEKGKFKDKFIE